MVLNWSDGRIKIYYGTPVGNSLSKNYLCQNTSSFLFSMSLLFVWLLFLFSVERSLYIWRIRFSDRTGIQWLEVLHKERLFWKKGFTTATITNLDNDGWSVLIKFKAIKKKRWEVSRRKENGRENEGYEESERKLGEWNGCN